MCPADGGLVHTTRPGGFVCFFRNEKCARARAGDNARARGYILECESECGAESFARKAKFEVKILEYRHEKRDFFSAKKIEMCGE